MALMKSRLLTSLKYAFYIVVILYAIQTAIYLFGLDLSFLGIIPRKAKGLAEIITSPFIHADFAHLAANTPVFFVLCWLFFLFYDNSGVFIWLWLLSGIITWVIGRNACHVGISGIIYALAAFMIVNGIISKNIILIILSLILAVSYSGLIYGVLPTNSGTSWEGHLGGLLSGIYIGIKTKTNGCNTLIKQP